MLSMSKMFDEATQRSMGQPGNNKTAETTGLVSGQSAQRAKSAGPPNRMNDLAYRDWMKYQKSFFRFAGTQNLVDQAILFFTKSVWEDGTKSRSLVVGADYCPCALQEERTIDVRETGGSWEKTVQVLSGFALGLTSATYDFVLLDLRALLQVNSDWECFREKQEGFFSALKSLLAADRYLMILAPDCFQDSPFPAAWAMASETRDYFKLRDEKVALVEETESIFYSLCFQAAEDARPSPHLEPETLNTAHSNRKFPVWTIPKPPPRKKNEVLHPAKYPETLCEEFIKIFTEPGETVIDPMVGTGSTVLAALNTGRAGVGIELNKEFAQIAEERIALHYTPQLFSEMEPQHSQVISGDVTNLSSMSELTDQTFSYCLTSPPYWNMLKNKGSENQANRRKKGLQLDYSETDERDLGNVENYDAFLAKLVGIYENIAAVLTEDGILTIVVKNVKRDRVSYPLAWDLTALLARSEGKYDYLGTTLWCQDDIGLKPFAIGIYWISNTLHHYCLHFRKRA